jgi:hypothetical protein
MGSRISGIVFVFALSCLEHPTLRAVGERLLTKILAEAQTGNYEFAGHRGHRRGRRLQQKF